MAEKTKGTAHIKIPDLTWTDYTTAASETWTFNHNLNVIGMIVQCYNNDDEMIMPLTVDISDANTTTITWSEPISGYVLVDYIERLWNFDSIINSIINGGYWKAGTGGSLTYNAVDNNDIQSSVITGNFAGNDEEGDFYYLYFTIPETNDDYNLTEIGIFNNSDNIMFYTNMSTLFKPSNMSININYRIEKVL